MASIDIIFDSTDLSVNLWATGTKKTFTAVLKVFKLVLIF